jgi:hypothetical protein
MHVKIISILLTFCILVIVSPAGAGDVKSTENTRSQETTIKVDENRIPLQKGNTPARQAVGFSKKLNSGLQPTQPYSITDYGAIMGTGILCVNFLRTMEETKKLRLTDAWQKVIYSYEFFHDPWRDRVLSSGEVNQADSSNSSLRQPIFRLYQDPNGDKSSEEGKIRSTLRLLQLKREEIFNEIFMGLRFSFGSKNKPMLVEMNISPFPEKGQGFVIAF